MDQIYVDGVVDNALKAGASSNPPVLRMATPLGVPLISSSNFDCSQVRVPSAKTKTVRRMEETTNSQRKRIKLKYLYTQMLGGEFRLSRAAHRDLRGKPKVHGCINQEAKLHP